MCHRFNGKFDDFQVSERLIEKKKHKLHDVMVFNLRWLLINAGEISDYCFKVLIKILGT